MRHQLYKQSLPGFLSQICRGFKVLFCDFDKLDGSSRQHKQHKSNAPSWWPAGSAAAACQAPAAAERRTNPQQTASTSCLPRRYQSLAAAQGKGGGRELANAIITWHNTTIAKASCGDALVHCSPSESSFRKLFGRSDCIMSPPSENTVFMVSMNHSLSGANVRSFIGKKNHVCQQKKLQHTSLCSTGTFSKTGPWWGCFAVVTQTNKWNPEG